MRQRPLPPAEARTSTTILSGLRDEDNRTVWQQYVERYRPLVVRYARRLGLADDDAEDAAQGTLLAFSEAYRAGRYDRAKGRLSSWLFGIATHTVRQQRRARAAGPRAVGGTEAERRLAEVAEDSELERLWEAEWRDSVLAECLRVVRNEVRPETMRAFEEFALAERPAEDVARSLGVSANAVFQAKRRILARVRELWPLVDDEDEP